MDRAREPREHDRTAAVGRAMADTPREGYLPAGQRAAAGVDAPLRLGHGSTCSQPSTVRTMLELLDVRPGDRVLDVGSGSGWTTAMLARLTGPPGSVLGVELVPELVADSNARLQRDGLTWARVEQASRAVLGAPSEGPFDRILVSAATSELSADLTDQLAPGGVLVLPLDARLVRVERTPGGLTRRVAPGWYSFVPLQRNGPPGLGGTEGRQP